VRFVVAVAAGFSLSACSLLFSDYRDRFGDDASLTDAGGGGDGPSSDGSHDAMGVDVFIPPCGAQGIPTGAGAQCPNPGMTCFMQTCCMTPDAGGSEYLACMTLGQCETVSHGTPWPCDKPIDCGQTGIQCCLDVSQPNYSLNRIPCPNQLTPEVGLLAPTCRTVVGGGCSGSEKTLCTQKSDCPDGSSCSATMLMTNPPKTIGLCE